MTWRQTPETFLVVEQGASITTNPAIECLNIAEGIV